MDLNFTRLMMDKKSNGKLQELLGSGETVVHKVGDRWITSPGHEVTLTNRGTIDHEHLFYTMIAAK